MYMQCAVGTQRKICFRNATDLREEVIYYVALGILVNTGTRRLSPSKGTEA